MKRKRILTTILISIVLLCTAQLTSAAPMGTAFTYQGWLMNKNNNKPADGLHDFEFSLFAEPSDANQVAGSISKDNVNVQDGFFSVSLDFGDDPNIFNGNARWLEISVRPDGGGSFTTLTPRQEVTPTPYALHTRGIFVDDAGNVGIGTTRPDALFQVGEGTFRVVRQPDNRAGIDDRTPDAKLEITPGGTDTDLLMLSSSPDTDGDLLIVTNNGNVGIGTTIPSTQLDVVGNINVTGTVNGVDVLDHAANANAHHTPPTMLPPSGPAGGDLSGAYPNPTLSATAHGNLISAIPKNIQVFTSNGTWIKPAGVSQVYVEVWGGGGGGGRGQNSGGGGGGGGGYAAGLVAVSGNVTVTVGSGGAGQAGGSAGSGGTSSFAGDTTIQATGGSLASSAGSGSGGYGSGGTINLVGSTGQGGVSGGEHIAHGGSGGGSPRGAGGGGGGQGNSNSPGVDGAAGQIPGGGGGGGGSGLTGYGAGGGGAVGMVIVYY